MYKLIGKRLDGRYEFLELIGAGGMADVYRVYDNVKKCDVAVKVLKEEFSKNREFVRRFKNESKANASLSHPNIVRIFDVDFGDKIQYIVMEYIDGVTLKEFIEKMKVLYWKDVVHFTFQILRALQHAHDKGIVHRDMKPQNVMLLKDGTIKIMDFGIARFARDERISVGRAIGSVHYISPEQASGGVTDARSDLYSVGIMMYEMLTGQLPFEGKTPEMVAVKQIQAHAKSPLVLNPKIPHGLVDIVVRAMQKDPRNRYQSAAEMLRDIDEFKNNPDVLFEYKYLNDESSTQYFTLSEKHEMKHIYDEEGVAFKNKMRSSQYGGGRNPNDKKGKLIPILLGVAAGVFLVSLIIIGVFVFGRGAGHANEVELPDFVGRTFDEIKNSGGKFGDFNFVFDYKDNSKFEEGQVCDQSPVPGMRVRKDSEVKLFISRGLKKKALPSVVGLNYKLAQQNLNREGFKNLSLVRKHSDSVSDDCVISTDPAEGVYVELDREIIIYYSGGASEVEKEKEIEVPNVVGKTVDNAIDLIRKAGFEVFVKENYDEGGQEGIVVRQSKTGKAKPKSVIEIFVNIKDVAKKPVEQDGGRKEEKQNSNSGVSVSGVKQVNYSFPLSSDKPISDTFKVVVTNKSGKVVSEGKYSTDGTVTINAQSSNNLGVERYDVKVTNTATGITAKYGTIDIDFSSSPCGIRPRFDNRAFSRTLKVSENSNDAVADSNVLRN